MVDCVFLKSLRLVLRKYCDRVVIFTCIYHRSEYLAKTLDYFPQVCWLHVFRGINYELHASCFRLEDSPLLVLFGLNQAGEKFTIPTILQK